MSEESQSSFVAPACILERVRNTNQIYNQIVKLLPNQQGAVVNGNKITVQFPVDSIFDLRSLSFDAYIQTCHNGNQSGNAANNYVQTYYLPRNGIASMISQLDIRVNDRSIQNISQYSYVYNAISDWVYNGSNIQDEVGALADPSLMTYMYKGKLYTRRGYPVSAYDNTLANTNLNKKQARFYYDALNRALESGHQFNIYFKNYQTFTGTSTIDKKQSMRITISSQSLNYLIGTFQAPNRTTITQPINTLISPPQSGENGVYSATFDNQVDSGMPRTFNNALYFVRNGSKIKSSKWSLLTNKTSQIYMMCIMKIGVNLVNHWVNLVNQIQFVIQTVYISNKKSFPRNFLY